MLSSPLSKFGDTRREKEGMKCSLSLFFALFLLSQSSTISVVVVAADYDLCNWLGSYYVTYDRCVASLKSDPSSRTADYHGLAVISVNLTIANATTVQSKFGQIVNSTGSDPTTRGLLYKCFSLYSGNMTSIKSAASEAEAKNYAGAADAMFKFAAMPGACDDGFRAKKGVASPLMRENLELMNLALVAHAINDFLSKYY